MLTKLYDADQAPTTFTLDRDFKVTGLTKACLNFMRPTRLEVGIRFGEGWPAANVKIPQAAMLECLRSAEPVTVEDYWLDCGRWIQYQIQRTSRGLTVTVGRRGFDQASTETDQLPVDAWGTVAAAVPVGLGLLSLDGYWLSTNERGLEILGHREMGLRDRRLADVCTSEQNADDEREFGRLLRGEVRAYTSERAIHRPDGRQVWVRFNFSVTHALTVGPRALAVVFDDIEERKAGDLSLQFALESAGMGDWDYDAALDLTRRSQRFNEIFGETNANSTWSFQTFLDHIVDEDRPAFDTAFRKALMSGHDLAIESRVTTGEGFRWVVLSGRVYLNHHGHAVRVAGLVRDVTAQKSAELALKRAKIEAEAANQEKSNFLANMSHEIRTPLGAILGFTDVLLETAPPGDEHRNHLEILSRNGRHLARLIDDILDLSKVESGHLEVERTPIQPEALVLEVISLLGLKAEAKGITLDHRGLKQMPTWIRADGVRLRQILMNVIGNALKFTSAGGVFLDADVQDGRLVLRVTDTGPGISDVALRNLFLPFSQADSSTSRVYGGTGLGLALSRRLARAMAGDLTLESTTLGQGSTFKVTLPFECVESASMSEAPVAAVVADSPGARSGQLRVLLADDSYDNQELIKYMLDRRGIRTTLADDGQCAIDLASQGEFDLVLMDMQMPRVDGYEATRRLRASGFRAPIVALTANAMKTDRDRCLSAGCSEYITKPIDAKTLYGVMDRIVAHAQN